MKRPAVAWGPALLGVVIALGVTAAAALGVPVAARTVESFVSFAVSRLAILPAVFVVIGLFEVWASRAAVERHLGTNGDRLAQWFWMVVLASTTVGGVYVALPIAAALRAKEARLGLFLAYLGLAGVVRIPMALFEIAFLGAPCTIIRFAVSVPLVILVSELLGVQSERRGYEMPGVAALADDAPAAMPRTASLRQPKSGPR